MNLISNYEPMIIRKRIVRWAKKNNHRILINRQDYIKLKLGSGYRRAITIYGSILRNEYGKLNIIIYTWGLGTFLILDWKGSKSALVAKDLKKELKAKIYGKPVFK